MTLPSPTKKISLPPEVSVPDAIRRQANILGESLHAPVIIWSKAGEDWTPVAALPWQGEVPTEELGLDSDRADTIVTTDTMLVERISGLEIGSQFIVPLLKKRQAPFLVSGVSTQATEEALRTLIASLLSGAGHADENNALNEENDSFAMQLSSDLEELTFLRTMVGSLANVAAKDELNGMAEQTLPVLNESVRARSLAFLVTDNVELPYESRVAYQIGESNLADKALIALVREYGPQARGQTVVCNWSDSGEPSSAPESKRPKGVSSLVITPLSSSDKLFGWLLAVNRTPASSVVESSWQLASDEFGSGEATLMATSASILAMHAANFEMVREKERIMVGVVRSLVSAIEAKDPYTCGHSERVALFTRRIAEQMGYHEQRAERLYLSGLLHDVGKIAVSDATLTKPGKLTEEERAEISRHPDDGWAILCDLEQLSDVVPGVLHHHERWDGMGYPDGLAGEAIPLDGRVMAVADAFDAMTSDRSYRKGMPNEKAQSILREGAGSQWDVKCVEAFFACLDDIHHIQGSYQQRDRPRRNQGAGI